MVFKSFYGSNKRQEKNGLKSAAPLFNRPLLRYALVLWSYLFSMKSPTMPSFAAILTIQIILITAINPRVPGKDRRKDACTYMSIYRFCEKIIATQSISLGVNDN
jgi:hypothetical protein